MCSRGSASPPAKALSDDPNRIDQASDRQAVAFRRTKASVALRRFSANVPPAMKTIRPIAESCCDTAYVS